MAGYFDDDALPEQAAADLQRMRDMMRALEIESGRRRQAKNADAERRELEQLARMPIVQAPFDPVLGINDMVRLGLVKKGDVVFGRPPATGAPTDPTRQQVDAAIAQFERQMKERK